MQRLLLYATHPTTSPPSAGAGCPSAAAPDSSTLWPRGPGYCAAAGKRLPQGPSGTRCRPAIQNRPNTDSLPLAAHIAASTSTRSMPPTPALAAAPAAPAQPSTAPGCVTATTPGPTTGSWGWPGRRWGPRAQASRRQWPTSTGGINWLAAAAAMEAAARAAAADRAAATAAAEAWQCCAPPHLLCAVKREAG